MVYNPDKAIHPGRIIARMLDREGMTQKNLGERTGLTEKYLSEIINGEASVSVETALLLENALGGSASFWINLEKDFQETKARIERKSLLKREVSLLNNYPYNELKKRGCVEATRDKEKQVENLWKFYGVNSLDFVVKTEVVVYRKRGGKEVKKEPITAWLRCGELEAKKYDLPEYSSSLLKTSIDELRKLVLETGEDCLARAKDILAKSGVAFVYIPHFNGTKVNGAVRWFGDRPILQLSLLGVYADICWFTLFHEIGHIVLHYKKEKFIEFEERELSVEQEKEKEAADFASDKLIPTEKYNDFLKQGIFSRNSIRKFAFEVGVHPGIVVGRLCHDNMVRWSKFADLRVRMM